MLNSTAESDVFAVRQIGIKCAVKLYTDFNVQIYNFLRHNPHDLNIGKGYAVPQETPNLTSFSRLALPTPRSGHQPIDCLMFGIVCLCKGFFAGAQSPMPGSTVQITMNTANKLP